ncbi:uncharacterized protein LAESUDRAFT_576349 [Laetiporus sulphureus 93-53]|uniref:IRG-type G domain-containing protein n=1 Tax=Laetiporus sulphureus 93-53 TaxID=1314785 RepID=A0A165B1C4_9APHY|nr:uncharacterized protein LAESUDRAFT_576349 [Laetiporus sulphureus 93-53]KZT00043.1 hypothetical protein LAESUDRAFT_576349 [Laetiporus sulphureus 93-53]
MGNVLSSIARWLRDDFRRDGKEGNMGNNATMDNMIVRMENPGGYQYKQEDHKREQQPNPKRKASAHIEWLSGQSGQNQTALINDATQEQTLSQEHVEQPTGLDPAFAKAKDTMTQDSETDSASLCSTDSEATVAIENISKVRHFFDTILPRAEKSLQQQLDPVILPTQEAFEETLQRLNYKEGFCHFAVAGAAGSGKSSLINSFRGLYAGNPGAAPVGTNETTKAITRYDDPDPSLPFV